MRQVEFQHSQAKLQYKGFKFLITDRPFDCTMTNYIREMKNNKVAAVVRVCEPSYKIDPLIANGIEVYNLEFADGMYPPGHIIQDWFMLLKKHFLKDPDACVAVHCVAGLGRAPVMVALALIELGLTYEDAVERIREQKRGAINKKQLCFLEKYRPKSRLRMKNRNLCSVM